MRGSPRADQRVRIHAIGSTRSDPRDRKEARKGRRAAPGAAVPPSVGARDRLPIHPPPAPSARVRLARARRARRSPAFALARRVARGCGVIGFHHARGALCFRGLFARLGRATIRVEVRAGRGGARLLSHRLRGGAPSADRVRCSRPLCCPACPPCMRTGGGCAEAVPAYARADPYKCFT